MNDLLARLDVGDSLCREAAAALRKEMEVQEALRSANSSLAEAAICHGDRANGLWTCPKAPCDYCLHYQRERAERADADVREMVKKAIENRLDGYRELAQRVADAERERDALRVRVTRLEGAIDRLHDFVVGETDYDLHEVTDYVNTVRWREAYAALKEGK